MKLHVMHDKAGKIVAAVRLDEDTPRPTRSGQRIAPPRPVPRPGFSCLDLDVPVEHAHLSFEEACKQLVVEGIEGKPQLALRRR